MRGLRSGRNLPNTEWADGHPRSVSAVRGNVRISANWSGGTSPARQDMVSAAVTAFATSLTLPAADEATARRLALGAGLVTHLTSLVLVDLAGRRYGGLPRTVKADLPTPRSSWSRPIVKLPAPRQAPLFGPPPPRSESPRRRVSRPAPTEERAELPQPEAHYEVSDSGGVRYRKARRSRLRPSRMERLRRAIASWLRSLLRWLGFRNAAGHRRLSFAARLSHASKRIDWTGLAGSLADGDSGELVPETAAEISGLAGEDAVLDAAGALGTNPVRLAVALMAAEAKGRHRSAARVLRRLLQGVNPTAL